MPEENVIAGEGAHFLERDFNQCFLQLRHYDAQIFEIAKLSLASFAPITGGALALYRYGVDKGADFTLPSASVLGIAFFIGILLFCLSVRNRVYMVYTSRYINEHRNHFLSAYPLGFKNATRMYTSIREPKFFNWFSSETLALYLLSALNSFVLGMALYIGFLSIGGKRYWVTVTCLVVFVIHVVGAVKYLKSKESKGAQDGVFGPVLVNIDAGQPVNDAEKAC